MTQYLIELVGGPKDGEKHSIPEDLAVYRLYAPDTSLTNWSANEDTPVEITAIEPRQIEYVRTDRISADGCRIYGYSGLKRA